MPKTRRKAQQMAQDAPTGAARRSRKGMAGKEMPQGSPLAEMARQALEKGPESRLFALDIGTRSVIGIVAERDEDGLLHVIATKRKEHKTRAMLDGQIHDVQQVAAIIQEVRRELAQEVGPIHSAAVAAAGRALYTMTAEASLEAADAIITEDEQLSLEFAAVQAAQRKLAESHTIDDPTRYYCVGYSTIRYELDGLPLKILAGQRGKTAKVVVIATFLPRQVIDSMQTALQESLLEMQALTLEPIAAINVLIPATMRHLNLVLVDIGAGTSDVAITRDGSVVAYGMVPQAGDEVTEAISHKFLLDFNVAETVKRKAANGEGAAFQDILGLSHSLKAPEIIEPILSNIQNLAAAIGREILDLNGGEAPQAVMLVGGGALTPMLPQFVASALSIPENRVAVRHPESVEGIADIPEELRMPDAVTPLGILKVASLQALHFLSVYVNGTEYNLFHFRDLTVSDALLGAGIDLKRFNGNPGLGVMVTIDGERKTFPGTMGTPAKLTLDGREATLETPIADKSRIRIEPGKGGKTPRICLGDLMADLPGYTIRINGKEERIQPRATVNGQPADPGRLLEDGDVVDSKISRTVGEALRTAGYPPTGRKIRYRLNGKTAQHACSPQILVNDEPATISRTVSEGDSIEYIEPSAPKLADVLDIAGMEASFDIYYRQQKYKVPSASLVLEVNGRTATPNTVIEDGCAVSYSRSERATATVSDALLAVDFHPPAPSSRATFQILVNGQPAEFTSPIKQGDTLEIHVSSRQAQGEDELVVPPEFAPPEPRQPRKMTISDFIKP